MIIGLVFVPLFALSGIEGRLFAPLGQAYIISILASLMVSITLTPVMAYFMQPGLKRLDAQEGRLIRILKSGNRALPGGHCAGSHQWRRSAVTPCCRSSGAPHDGTAPMSGMGRRFIWPRAPRRPDKNIWACRGPALSARPAGGAKSRKGRWPRRIERHVIVA